MKKYSPDQIINCRDCPDICENYEKCDIPDKGRDGAFMIGCDNFEPKKKK